MLGDLFVEGGHRRQNCLVLCDIVDVELKPTIYTLDLRDGFITRIALSTNCDKERIVQSLHAQRVSCGLL